nr:RDD family protein [Propionibacterium sp.]
MGGARRARAGRGLGGGVRGPRVGGGRGRRAARGAPGGRSAAPRTRRGSLGRVSEPAAPDPGASFGLPSAGRGSLAPWGARLAALLLDWAACLLVATGLFGTAVLWGSGWRLWTPLATYFVEKAVLTAVAGGSFGQLIAGVGVMRLDGGRIGVLQALLRSALVCLVIPAIVIGPARRGLHDVLLGTVVVKSR